MLPGHELFLGSFDRGIGSHRMPGQVKYDNKILYLNTY